MDELTVFSSSRELTCSAISAYSLESSVISLSVFSFALIA